MKMTIVDYNYLKSRIKPIMRGVTARNYFEKGLTEKRYRWDLLYLAGLSKYLCSTLYMYLNDEHIDTALRKITNTN